MHGSLCHGTVFHVCTGHSTGLICFVEVTSVVQLRVWHISCHASVIFTHHRLGYEPNEESPILRWHMGEPLFIIVKVYLIRPQLVLICALCLEGRGCCFLKLFLSLSLKVEFFKWLMIFFSRFTYNKFFSFKKNNNNWKVTRDRKGEDWYFLVKPSGVCSSFIAQLSILEFYEFTLAPLYRIASCECRLDLKQNTEFEFMYWEEQEFKNLS